jgi:hypothetical protein
MTDVIMKDPIWAVLLEKRCGKVNGSNTYLVNSSLALRFLNRIDKARNEPGYCDKGKSTDAYDSKLIHKFDVWSKDFKLTY